MSTLRFASPWCARARHALIDAGMTQKSLAEKIGVSHVTVSAVINGRYISEPIINKISEALGIDNSYFV